jgi:heptosyltransferase II
MRTLILSPRSIADAVMTQPMLALLKRGEPQTRVDVLAGPFVAPVYEAMAEVDRVFASRHAFGRLQPLGKLLLSRRLGRLRHDRAIALATEPWGALMPWLTGIPVRIGLKRDLRWRMINDPRLDADDGRSPAERYARLAFDSLRSVPARIPEPVLVRDAGREAAIRAKAGLGRDAPLLALCVGTDGARSRRWPARHFAAVAAMAAAQWPGIVIAVLGDAAHRGLATEIAALSGEPLRNLCGALTVGDTLALLAQAHGVIAGDGWPMQVAAAYGRPMVALFGPTHPRRAAVRAPRTRVEWLRIPCSPCNARSCELGHNACMSEIGPEPVFQSLRAGMQFSVRDIR